MEYYNPEELTKSKRQRKKLIWIFWIIVALYVLFSAGMITWYALLPYKSPTQSTVKLIHYPITILLVVFTFIFLGIPFKRANKFYKLFVQLEQGTRETGEGVFIEYDDALQVKDGVDFKSLIFIEWNKYKNDYFERKVLVLYEKDFPEIEERAKVRFITQANVLISYEIIDELEIEKQELARSEREEEIIKKSKKIKKKATIEQEVVDADNIPVEQENPDAEQIEQSEKIIDDEK